MSSRVTLVLGVLLLAFNVTWASADEKVPANRRAMIFGRMLAYDGNLRSRAGDAVVLAVVSKAGNGASEVEAAEMFSAFKALEQVRLVDLPFKVTRVSYSNAGALEAKIGEQGVDALYVCGGLEGELDAISAVSHRKKVLTLTAAAGSVRGGLSVAVYSKDDKSSIILNLPASKAEGAAFGGDVLRLAEVIR